MSASDEPLETMAMRGLLLINVLSRRRIAAVSKAYTEDLPM
jgi:hypothetical protein